MSTTPAPLLTPTDLADRWSIPLRRLATWRYQGGGPAYLKIGGAVRYRVQDVEAYEAERMFRATA